MTTQKHLRDEEIVDTVEPPRKKSKKLESNSERTNSKKDKKHKEKREKAAVDTEDRDATEKVSKKDKKKSKKSKKEKKAKADDEEAVDAPEAAVKEVPGSEEQGSEAPKEKKKSRKDKKSKKFKVTDAEQQVDGEMVDAPAEILETEPTTETVTPESNVADGAVKEKKSKKDKKKSKKEKNSKTSSPDTQAANGTQSNNGLVTASSSYTETNAVRALSEPDVSTFLSKHNITATNPKPSYATYRPIISFDHLPSTTLLNKSPFAEYKEPTPIQAASWPYGLAGRDIIGVAETGSGKTMAFALPCVEAVLAASGGKDRKTTRAVIVSPTRELAMQTNEQVSKLCSLVGLNCVCIYGGASKDDQRYALRKGAAVVVATPGRLKDFISDGGITLDKAAFVVLDEADRMLDKGFEEDIKEILSSCPAKEKRQTLMFTATWPFSVQSLASTFMIDPVKITIGRGNGADASDSAEVKLQANDRIKQEVEVIDQRAKEQRVLQLLKKYQSGAKKDDRILVFCLYKKEAVRVENFLSQRGVRVGSIHGDLKQEQRTRSLEAFKQGKTPVLVATDVAARGLDIPEVKLVLNVTFPLTIEDYVHRIGRTGRAGKDGHAITMFTEHDKAHSGELINILKASKQAVPDELLKFGTTVKRKGHDAYGAFFKAVDTTKRATKITFD
ncbi:DEAD-domain-containing protein [Zalerion maritima]|uniref:RNA helicase n=1 Tax=Zalerion maritima TaxID=339359 RepID=A0AAD5RSJ0_9PEZI|nr:DEAD-domain-containing protein [Zalerion maritima]